MVIPESPETKDPTGSPRLRLLGTIGAAILTLGALSVLGRSTTPPPSAEPAPSSTATTVALSAPTTASPVPEQGEPLVFAPISNDRDWPLSINTLNGQTLFFYTGPRGLGAEAWVYHGSGAVQPLEVVIAAGHHVQLVLDTWFGLLAVGTEIGSGQPVVWSSGDGVEWTETFLPTGDLGELHVRSAHASADLVVITGQTQVDVDSEAAYTRAQNVLTERFGYLLEDLGLDAEEYRLVEGPEGPGIVWASRDGVSWTMAVDGFHGDVDEMFTGLDGHIWAIDFGVGEAGFDATADGESWRAVPSTHQVHQVEPWGNRLIGLDHFSRLLLSREGVNWRPLELPGFLTDNSVVVDGVPRSSHPWYIEQISGGATGVAVIANAVRVVDFSPNTERTQILIKKEGVFELWYEHQMLSGDSLTVRDEDGQVLWSNDPDSNHKMSLEANGAITLESPLTGSALLTVEVSEIRAVRFPPAGDRQSARTFHQALLYTSTGSDWIVQDLGEYGRGLGVSLARIVGDELLLATNHPRGTVWWAPVPRVRPTPLP